MLCACIVSITAEGTKYRGRCIPVINNKYQELSGVESSTQSTIEGTRSKKWHFVCLSNTSMLRVSTCPINKANCHHWTWNKRQRSVDSKSTDVVVQSFTTGKVYGFTLYTVHCILYTVSTATVNNFSPLRYCSPFSHCGSVNTCVVTCDIRFGPWIAVHKSNKTMKNNCHNVE